MSDVQTLDQIFDGKTAERAAPAQETVREQPQAEVTTGERPDSAVPPADASHQELQADDARQVPIKALEDERKKRQEFETKFKELEKRMSAPPQPRQQQAQQQQQPQIPDPVLEPDKFIAYQNKVMESRIFQNNVRVSQRMMRQQHPDYDEIEAIFADAAERDVALRNDLLQSDFPAEYAYQIGKRIKFLREIGDNPESYIEAKVAERLAAQQAGAQPQQQSPASRPSQSPPPRSAVPKSLAGVPSAQPRDNAGRFAAPPSLSDILD